MFSNLTERLTNVVKDLRGRARLSEEQIEVALREVRMAMLEGDVALPVVKDFIDKIKVRALGEEVIGTLTPGQALIRVVRDQLTHLMGDTNADLNFAIQPPAVILMTGLQGAGKTTTTAKLARYLAQVKKKKVGVVSCDVYRPAAIEQLNVLAAEVNVDCYPSDIQSKPVDIAKSALQQARKSFSEVLIIDTAGRLAIDGEMMQELTELQVAVDAHETLFVVDAMMGQDAINTAKAFNDSVPLTGIVLTKADGDARGGAALSVRYVTGKPIKFVGIGEKIDALEPFHPDRIASRILGMGDVLSLIEEVEQKVDKEKAEKVARKLKKGKGFDLQDFRDQLLQMQNMGGLSSVIGRLPGASELTDQVKDNVNDKELIKLGSIIDSMTIQERQYPAILKSSRKKRIAAGSGTQVQDVNRLLKQFNQMQKMMKRMSKKGGMKNLMRGMGGRTPPGMQF
ncbi:MAG TPA: signal recognition particle protein [Gammaproteobacteria bacterium]|nr:signal recognition particle protein [Gammaproteobacteria bacterium]